LILSSWNEEICCVDIHFNSSLELATYLHTQVDNYVQSNQINSGIISINHINGIISRSMGLNYSATIFGVNILKVSDDLSKIFSSDKTIAFNLYKVIRQDNIVLDYYRFFPKLICKVEEIAHVVEKKDLICTSCHVEVPSSSLLKICCIHNETTKDGVKRTNLRFRIICSSCIKIDSTYYGHGVDISKVKYQNSLLRIEVFKNMFSQSICEYSKLYELSIYYNPIIYKLPDIEFRHKIITKPLVMLSDIFTDITTLQNLQWIQFRLYLQFDFVSMVGFTTKSFNFLRQSLSRG
jgi:hypothetical protein